MCTYTRIHIPISIICVYLVGQRGEDALEEHGDEAGHGPQPHVLAEAAAMVEKYNGTWVRVGMD